MKKHLFVWLAVLTNTIGNFLLSVGMHQVQMSHTAYGLEYLRMFANPWIDAGVLLLIIWLASQLSLLSWADLSFVLPVTAFGYFLAAVLGKVFLHEDVTASQWLGTCLIFAGIALVGGTHQNTTNRKRIMAEAPQ